PTRRSSDLQDAVTPVEQDPADIQQDDDTDQAGAQRDEESDRLLASGDYHNSSLICCARPQTCRVHTLVDDCVRHARVSMGLRPIQSDENLCTIVKSPCNGGGFSTVRAPRRISRLPRLKLRHAAPV